MRFHRLRLLLLLACATAIGGGCAGVPSVASQPGAAVPPAAAPDTAGAVIAASASAPVQSLPAADPLAEAALPADPVATPPPMLPAELPDASLSQAAAPKEENNGFDWSDLEPENVYKSLKAAAGYGPNEGIARATMKEGRSLFAEKKYAEAAGKFASAADRWPDSPLEEDAMFLLAESYFFSDQYPKAHDVYGRLLKKYGNTRHLDTVVAREFALGRYWEQLHRAKPLWPIAPNATDASRPQFDTFGNAMDAYQRVQIHDPIGPLADDSLMATASAYFRNGQYEKAAYYYDLLRKEYPNSPFQKQAHLLAVQAKLRIYQGNLYDGKPLEEAGQIADQTLTQFGPQLGEERQRVLETRGQILERQAERDYAVAQFYETKKAFGAARYYYQEILNDYPETRQAQQARARLEKIRDLPDNPPNRFAWLTDLFPSGK